MPDATPTPEEHRGFAQMPVWLQRSTTVSGPAKLTYLALSSRADENGECYPSHELIAQEASCSVATVKRVLQDLRALGVVSWKKRPRQDGTGQSSNTYKITIAKQPVDNFGKAVAHSELPGLETVSRVAQGELGGSSPRATKKNHLTKDLNKSSVIHETHVTGAVDNSGDDDRNIHRPNPSTVPHEKRGIDWAIVIGRAPAFTHFAPDDLHVIGAEILDRAKTTVIDQTAYVARALELNPFEWQQAAFALDTARAARGGNDF
jgi:hypothetical protein